MGLIEGETIGIDSFKIFAQNSLRNNYTQKKIDRHLEYIDNRIEEFEVALDKTDKEEKILVFDLGGGTFDVSILELGDGVFDVLATAGDNKLGGDDFDQKIIDHMVEEFKKENGIDLSTDKMALQRLKDAAEKAKKDLSGVTSAQISLPFITAGEAGPLH